MLITRNCLYCGKEFQRKISTKALVAGRGKYCSLECADKGRVGLKRSQEFRTLISELRRNRPKERVQLSCLTCGSIIEESLAHAKRGRKYCSVECHAKSRMGVPFTQERKDNISRAKQTVSHPNSPEWQKGLSVVNNLIRNSRDTHTWRDAILKRDEYQCGFCGKVGGKLQADHILPFSLYPEKRFDVDNGQTLCKECHKFKTGIDRYFYDNYSTRL